MQQKNITLSEGLKNATGEIPFTFLNDYMFRVIFQDKKNEDILRSLICSCLNLKPADIARIEVTNPIVPGESPSEKTYILDLNISMNDNTSINLEMQVVNLHNWPERSLAYLARNYDSLNKGTDYRNAISAYHIGFLDYTLFPEHPEFFAKYQMLNVKNHHLFTSKFNLYVLDLNQIDLATKQDQENQLDFWAKLFKAKTWEDIKMVTEKNPELIPATEELFLKNQDDIIKQQCRAREEYYAIQKFMENQIQDLNATIISQASVIEEKDEEIRRLKALLAKQNL